MNKLMIKIMFAAIFVGLLALENSPTFGQTVEYEAIYLENHHRSTGQFTEVDTSIIRHWTDEWDVEYVQDKFDGSGLIRLISHSRFLPNYVPDKRVFEIPYRIKDMVVFEDTLYLCGQTITGAPFIGFVSLNKMVDYIPILYSIDMPILDCVFPNDLWMWETYYPKTLRVFRHGRERRILALATAKYKRRNTSPFLKDVQGSTDLIIDVTKVNVNDSPFPSSTISRRLNPIRVNIAVDHLPWHTISEDHVFLTYDNLAIANNHIAVVGHLDKTNLTGANANFNNKQEIAIFFFEKPQDTQVRPSIFGPRDGICILEQNVWVLPSWKRTLSTSAFHSDWIDANNKSYSKVYAIDGGNTYGLDCFYLAAKGACLPNNDPWKYGISVIRMSCRNSGQPVVISELFYENNHEGIRLQDLRGIGGEYSFLYNDGIGEYGQSYIVNKKKNTPPARDGSSSNPYLGSFTQIYPNSIDEIHSFDTTTQDGFIASSHIIHHNKYGNTSFIWKYKGLSSSNNQCSSQSDKPLHYGHNQFPTVALRNDLTYSSITVNISREYLQYISSETIATCPTSQTDNAKSHNSTLPLEDASTTITPNPAHDYFTISSEQDITYIEILTFEGQKVKTAQINGHSMEISVSDIDKGIYIVRAHHKDLPIETLKLVVQ